ncbi:MAG: hypothetical protein NTV80_16815 [Verrucomicrobia bacterium]|nr:hypothetical protein [Verrucomicrobiota bacterium]
MTATPSTSGTFVTKISVYEQPLVNGPILTQNQTLTDTFSFSPTAVDWNHEFTDGEVYRSVYKPITLSVGGMLGRPEEPDERSPNDPEKESDVCSSCSTCGKGPSAVEAKLNSIDLEISLGKLPGREESSLSLNAPEPTDHLFKLPTAFTLTNAAHIPAGTSEPAQILSESSVVVIIDPLPDDMVVELRFYDRDLSVALDTNGHYPIPANSTPTAIIHLDDPTPAAASRTFRVRHTSLGQEKSWTYSWLAPSGELQLSSTSPLEGTVTERLLRVKDEPTGDTISTRTEFDASGDVVAKVRSTFRNFPFGERQISSVIDPDGRALTTLWTYYLEPSTDINNPVHGYGRVRSMTNPSGYWESYEYDSAEKVVKTYSQHLNQAMPASFTENGPYNVETWQFFEYSENTPEVPSRMLITTKRDGIELKRRFRVAHVDGFDDVECLKPGAAWNDPTNLVSTFRYIDDELGNPRIAQEVSTTGHKTLHTYKMLDAAGLETTQVNAARLWLHQTEQGSADTSSGLITHGTRTETATNKLGVAIYTKQWDVETALLISHQLAVTWDEAGRVLISENVLSGRTSQSVYDCCGLESTTDERGLTTTYTRTSTEETQTTAGVTTKTVTSGLTKIQLRKGADGSWLELGRQTVNLAGETVSSYSRGTGLVLESRTHGVANQREVHTRTFADGGVSTETRYPDGTLDRVTGTATRPMLHEVGVEAGVNVDGVIQNVVWEKDSALDDTGALSGEWTRSWTDMAGRVWKLDTANGGVNRSHYNTAGQLIKQVDADNVTTLYAYDDQGRLSVTALDMDRNGVIDYNGTDRISRTTHSVTPRAGATVQRTITEVWATDGSPNASVISTQDQSVDGLQNWQEQGGLTTQQYDQPVGGTWAGSWTTTTLYPDNSTSVQTYTLGRLTSSVRKDALNVLVESTSTTHDPHGRVITQTDGRGAVTTLIYDSQPNPVSGGYSISADLLYQLESPPQTVGGTIPVTTYLYDAMGRRTTTTDALNGTSIQSYTKRGEVETITGTRQYPLSYTYTAQGRMKTMTTSSGITTWYYHPDSGLLANKVYGTQPAYSLTYTVAGRTLTKTNGRGTVITYGNNNAGEVGSIDYSDATADVTFTYDRLGQSATSAQTGGATHTANRNLYGQLTSESWAGGLLNTYNLDHPLDTLRRPSGLTIKKAASVLMQHTQSYDDASRLKTITVPAAYAAYNNTSYGQQTATYLYESNTNQVNSLDYVQGGSLAYHSKFSYNAASTATGIHYFAGQAQAPFAGNSYTLDDINRRSTSTMTQGTVSIWGYNDRSEVTSESEALPGPVMLPTYQNAFSYDSIGNRLNATAGTGSKSYTTKTPSVFNQYASITQPAVFPVTGTFAAGYNVIVNSLAAQKAGQYFWADVPVANTAGASFPAITVRAAKPGAGANGADLVKTTTYRPYMRPAAAVMSYDDDGNLTQDARWDYTWDAENRLISMTERRDNVIAAPVDPIKKRLVFGYDARSRRTSKTVYDWNAVTSTWTNLYEHTFVWSGWHLVHEKITSTNTVLANERSYVWGIDHAGNARHSSGTLVYYRQYHTLQATGGFNLTAIVPRLRPVAHDLEGNVTGVLSGESADHFDIRFDYDCSGTERQEYYQNNHQSQFNGITVSKSSCPLRFSGQYFDPETKLNYYGYRYYNPELGRWISRDPIEERGGVNLYGMVGNDPVNRVDYLGLKTIHIGYIGDGTESNLNTDGEKWAEGLRSMLEMCSQKPGLQGVWERPTVETHYSDSKAPKGDYDLFSIIDKIRRPRAGVTVSDPYAEGRAEAAFEKALLNEVIAKTTAVTGIRVIVSGGGRTTWRPVGESPNIYNLGGFVLPINPGSRNPDNGYVFMKAGTVDGIVLSHEFGHVVGWRDLITKSTHSLNNTNLMSWGNGKREPDCQWCEKILKLADKK